MAKAGKKATSKPSIDEPIQLTLDQLLDKQPNQPIEWEFAPDDIGGELLGILSKGLYPDPLDCIREYVQNSVDAKAKNVTIKITGNSVMIRDDGMGMDLAGLLQARRLGLSNKSQYEDVGFRGIGIYSGFDICNRLLVTTKTPGEAKARILEFDFGEMKAQLKTERDAKTARTSLTKLLTTYTHFKQEEDEVDRHYTIVQLEELSKVHIGHLADHQRLRTYMLHNLPIDFADNFPYKDMINSQLENHVPGYNAIRVKLITDFHPPEIIVRPNIPNLREPFMESISNENGKKVAYYWACLHAKGGELPDEYGEYRGLLYKVKGFTIGDRSRLRAYFTTAKGTLYDWCTGEVYVIDENVVPNAARNDFEASPEKLQLEAAVREQMRKLNKKASDFQEQKNADRDFERAYKYLDETEKKVGSYHLDECNEALQQIERHLENLNKKKKKMTFDQTLVLETKQRAENLKNILRKMIYHPGESSTKKTTNSEQSPGSDVLSFTAPQSPLKPIAPTPKPASVATALPSEPKPDLVPSPKPTPDVIPPPLSAPAKTLMQVFGQSGLDISGSCTQLLQIIDRSLSSVLAKGIYERVLEDLEARLDYEITGEIESEDE